MLQLLLLVGLCWAQMRSTCGYAGARSTLAPNARAEFPIQYDATTLAYQATGLTNMATGHVDLFNLFVLTRAEYNAAVATNFSSCSGNLSVCGPNVTCAFLDTTNVVGLNLSMLVLLCLNTDQNCRLDSYTTVESPRPDCAARCSYDMISNFRCNPQCNNLLCQRDGRDCDIYPWCDSPACPIANYQNGICEPACNNVACDYDGTDCLLPGLCATGCSAAQQGDGTCQAACNVAACNFDSGDCVGVQPQSSDAARQRLFQ
jgi:hypothetical protein